VDALTRGGAVALACAVGALACAEWAGPGVGGPRLSIVPMFAAGATAGGGTLLLDDLDQLHVIVFPSTQVITPGQAPPRAPERAATRAPGALVDTIVAVDAAGNASITLPLLVVGSAQTYVVQLEGIRSRDGAVLYSGGSVVTLQPGRPTPVDSVPVAYIGPCPLGAGCVVSVGPKSTSALNALPLLKVSLPVLSVPDPALPGATVPPDWTVTAPETVPLPASVAVFATITGVEAMLPVTFSVPWFRLVIPV